MSDLLHAKKNCDVGQVAADDLQRFALLARSVAGQVLVVVPSDDLAHTDGHRLHLPPASGVLTVCAQAALVAADSLTPAVLSRLIGRRALTERYLIFESARATLLLGSILSTPVLSRLVLHDGPVSSSSRQSLHWARDPTRIAPAAPAWLGQIKPLAVLTSSARGRPNGQASQNIARADEALLETLDTAADDSPRSRMLDLLTAPVRNPLASRLKDLFGGSNAPAGPRGEQRHGDDEFAVGRRLGPRGPGTPVTARNFGAGAHRRALDPGSLYPEWDAKYGRYRENWCTVSEIDPPASSTAVPATTTFDEPLRRQLARLGSTRERHRRQDRGDTLDLTALVDVMVDRSTGFGGDDRVYEDSRPTAHDLSVLILLDTTGSTGASGSGRTVFDEQRRLADTLTAALEDLGNRVAAYGFHSRGRNAVRFMPIKDFDDRYEGAARIRLQALAPGGFTRLGAAIRHATHLLKTRAGTSQMLLVLIGDGFPYENGYEERYAEQDTRRALNEATALGVGCVCISVSSDTDAEALHRIWGDVPYRWLDAPAALAQHVRPLFRDALRAAAANKPRNPNG
ncbi:VWA domain-containing protein [Mycolicibacterium sp.]|uniref:nitric oxide reductase activation protein NorD n=1 Tax=Mycolicibacterium sp. TaxID=2320850 RepID=UPI001A2FD6CA|nr:VWA domain-containing protein [Mycolicibacterium sp.]MBJ7336810.1 VWA domain-containing protein [Mycolicibacterium sp.]